MYFPGAFQDRLLLLQGLWHFQYRRVWLLRERRPHHQNQSDQRALQLDEILGR